MQIEGPAVAELQRSFVQTWRHQEGSPLAERTYFPHLDAQGNALVQVIPSYPGETHRLTYVMYVAAVKNARYSIDLTTPYFVPDHQMREAIAQAAKRGVDVRIVLPSSSDSNLALFAGRFFYNDLLESGVRLYELRDRMLHAKTAVIDGVWGTVGSSNMDLWSFLHNNEMNVIVIGKDFADKIEDLFEQDLNASDEVTSEKWSAEAASENDQGTFCSTSCALALATRRAPTRSDHAFQIASLFFLLATLPQTDPYVVLPRLATRIPNKTIRPPKTCQAPMASFNKSQASKAAVTGWTSRATEEKEAWRWARAKAIRLCPATWEIKARPIRIVQP